MNRNDEHENNLSGTDDYREASDEAIAIQQRYKIDVGPDWWDANITQKLDLRTASKQQILETFMAALDRDFPISPLDENIRIPRAE
jgi:hypothetical protein